MGILWAHTVAISCIVLRKQAMAQSSSAWDSYKFAIMFSYRFPSMRTRKPL